MTYKGYVLHETPDGRWQAYPPYGESLGVYVTLAAVKAAITRATKD